MTIKNAKCLVVWRYDAEKKKLLVNLPVNNGRRDGKEVGEAVYYNIPVYPIKDFADDFRKTLARFEKRTGHNYGLFNVSGFFFTFKNKMGTPVLALRCTALIEQTSDIKPADDNLPF